MFALIMVGAVILITLAAVLTVASVIAGWPDKQLDALRKRVHHFTVRPGYELSGYDNILRAWRHEHSAPVIPRVSESPAND